MTPPHTVRYRFGLEELAVAIRYAVSVEDAKAMLLGNYGNLTADEERGRLLAGSHSLMARNLLVMLDNTPRLDKGLTDCVQMLFHQDYIIRMSRGSGVTEQLCVVHFKNNRMVMHQITQGVVHELSWIDDVKAVTSAASGLFDLKPDSVSRPVGEIPFSVLDDSRTKGTFTPTQTEALLVESGLPVKVAHPLSEDFNLPKYRGSIVRLQIKEDKPSNEKGIFLLGGKARSWLFILAGNQPDSKAAIYRANATILSEQMADMFL